MAKYNISPFSKVDAREISKHLLKSLGLDVNGIFTGFDLSLPYANKLRITPGKGLINNIYFGFIDSVYLNTISVSSDTHFFIVAHYPTPSTPPEEFSEKPIVEIKLIEPITPLPNDMLYLGSVDIKVNPLHFTNLSYFDSAYNMSRVILWGHNQLSSLQGGDVLSREYYHLTKAEKDDLHVIVDFFNNLNANHNALGLVQGGNVNERYHLTNDFYLALLAVLHNDVNAWHNSPIYTNGGFINADKLDTLSVLDIAVYLHLHNHTLLDGIQGSGDYHLKASDIDTFRQRVINDTWPDAEHLNGLSAINFASVNHSHVHNDTDGIKGGQPGEYYHLTLQQKNTFFDNITDPSNINTDLLNGYDSSMFALATHNHSHNNVSNIQGGNATERYHATQQEHDFIVNMANGNVIHDNTDKLDYKDATDFSPNAHSHDHNTVLNIQGGGVNERYHINVDFYSALNNANSLSSNNVLATSSDIVPIKIHNNLTDIQGGEANERYHLKVGEYNTLTLGNDASNFFHIHDSYYHKNVVFDRYINVDGDTLNVDLDLHSFNIVNLGSPSDSGDLVSKQYVDNALNPQIDEHNEWSNIQGGNVNERYHLTESDHDALVYGYSTNLHHHDNFYYSDMDNRYFKLSGGDLNGNLDMDFNDLTVFTTSQIVADNFIANKWYVDYVEDMRTTPHGACLMNTLDNESNMNPNFELYVREKNNNNNYGGVYNLVQLPNINETSYQDFLVFMPDVNPGESSYLEINKIFACHRLNDYSQYTIDDDVVAATNFGYMIQVFEYSDAAKTNFKKKHLFILKFNNNFQQSLSNDYYHVTIMKHLTGNYPESYLTEYDHYGCWNDTDYYATFSSWGLFVWYDNETNFLNGQNEKYSASLQTQSHSESAHIYPFKDGCFVLDVDGNMYLFFKPGVLRQDAVFSHLGSLNVDFSSSNTNTSKLTNWPTVIITDHDYYEFTGQVFIHILGVHNLANDECFDAHVTFNYNGSPETDIYINQYPSNLKYLVKEGVMVNADFPYLSLGTGVKRVPGVFWSHVGTKTNNKLLSPFTPVLAKELVDDVTSGYNNDDYIVSFPAHDVPINHINNGKSTFYISSPEPLNGGTAQKLYLRFWPSRTKVSELKSHPLMLITYDPNHTVYTPYIHDAAYFLYRKI